jgi:hypothetical protein
MSGSERFEVIARTRLGRDVPLGEADGLPAVCQLIESVDRSKYEPVEYTLRKLTTESRQEASP